MSLLYKIVYINVWEKETLVRKKNKKNQRKQKNKLKTTSCEVVFNLQKLKHDTIYSYEQF